MKTGVELGSPNLDFEGHPPDRFSKNPALRAVDFLDQVCLTNKELQWQVGRKTCGTLALEARFWTPLL